MSCLVHFHLLTLQSKITAYDYYQTVSRFTDNAGIFVSLDRYKLFLRAVWQWRHLKLLKRAGRANDPGGVAATEPGGLAVLCPACPNPEWNIPEEELVDGLPEDQDFNSPIYSIDANFHLKRKQVSSHVSDPGLGTGWAYFVEEKPYKNYIKQHEKDPEQDATCSNHHAQIDAEKGSRGYDTNGIAAVICSRHQFFLPTAVGDLAKGERFCCVDFIFLSGIRHFKFRGAFISREAIKIAFLGGLRRAIAERPFVESTSGFLQLVRYRDAPNRAKFDRDRRTCRRATSESLQDSYIPPYFDHFVIFFTISRSISPELRILGACIALGIGATLPRVISELRGRFSAFTLFSTPLAFYSMIIVGSRSQNGRVHSYRPRIVVLEQRIIGSPPFPVDFPSLYQSCQESIPLCPHLAEPELLFPIRRRVDFASCNIAHRNIALCRHRSHRVDIAAHRHRSSQSRHRTSLVAVADIDIAHRKSQLLHRSLSYIPPSLLVSFPKAVETLFPSHLLEKPLPCRLHLLSIISILFILSLVETPFPVCLISPLQPGRESEPGVGRTDGEGIERDWSGLNSLATSIREMGPGSRHDTLDDHFGDWNFRWTVALPEELRAKLIAAMEARNKHSKEHQAFTESLPKEAVDEWQFQLTEWERDRNNVNPYEMQSDLREVTQGEVRKRLLEAEAADLQIQLETLEGNDHAVEDTSITEFIVGGLAIEVAQAQLRDEAAQFKDPTAQQAATLQRKRNSLQRKIIAWRRIQVRYMPVTTGLLPQAESVDVANPEDTKLLLPSQVPPRLRETCLGNVADKEWQLRLGQLGDSLAQVRRSLCVRTHLMKYKQKNVRGQRPNTRHNALIDSNNNRTRHYAATYNRAHQAMLLLDPLRDDWQKDYAPLSENDLVPLYIGIYSDDDPKTSRKSQKDRCTQMSTTSEGNRTIPWIWRSREVYAEIEDDLMSSGQLNEGKI
ncbi:hypothetical protein NLI96_g10506 [Meripilus lineatus]|uniref:CxC2-like cysteine cluster KDZ transposase-associated domain-containing protein n=1 Tax=Meripilus lineatus TaxID=2056292 RepID=A0AAD5UUZ8_9APHY|nr:hypothetical protein NLI96_g10506 [Physisporinus lineatus]